MAAAFNPPPGWPAPDPGWVPPKGWRPDPSWPPAPPGWQFWTNLPDQTTGAAGFPAVPGGSMSGLAYGSAAPVVADTPTRGSAGSRTAPWWGWGGFAGCALLGLTSGLGGVIGFAGVFAFVVALVALVRGHVRWAHLPGRAAGAIALVAAVVAVSVGSALSPATAPVSASTSADQSGAPASRAPDPSPMAPSADSTSTTTVAPSPTGATTTTSATAPDPELEAVSAAHPGTALALVGTLVVKGRGPMTGYSRAAFGPAWTDTDRNGCDQRNDTLRRDLRAVTLKAGTNGCAVMTGTLTDPYTAATISFSRTAGASAVQIDHVVALADAWVKGAAGWPQSERTAFANDTLNLLAVSGSANAAKGSGDAATWLPRNTAYRCSYVARQVAVKAKYHLSVTSAERAAMVRVLSTCATTTPPTATVAKLGGAPLYAVPTPKTSPSPAAPPAPKPTSKPAPKPAPAPPPAPKPAPKPASPATVQGVHPGAFCAPQGALGYTVKGTLMRCTFKSGDIRARWRSA
ncbi:HNH endonuclease family protein [Terrabacter sp. NPDC080008]|uniref:HNH endonuclease family protein n=1 Tax=Terrabacter sp. NPDC080008 TaxID=3155176 RepID=UPI003450DA05